MFIYNIILAFDFPLDLEEYKTAPQLELKEAQWIFRTFPFEEPAYLAQHPEEGPAPHILFVNQLRDDYLLISYEGESRYQLTFGKGKGAHKILHDLGTREVKEALSLFWNHDTSFEEAWLTIQQVYQKYTFF